MTEEELTATLQRAAATYLNRFAPSVYQFRQMLLRKCKKLPIDLNQETVEHVVNGEILRRIQQGILNDRRYAESWAQKMQAAGKSLLQIKVKLHQKRISKEIIDQTVSTISDHQHQLTAALLYAKKRRLGPFSSDRNKDAKQRWKELQKMVRAGHTFDVSKQILEGDLKEADLDGYL